jgi:hypothetical protein
MLISPRSGARAPRLSALVVPPLLASLAILLTGCSPDLDWREVKAADGGYTVLLPAKPSSDTRRVDLAGKSADMTMRGAEVDRVTYAVGSVVLGTEEEARRAASEMQQALVHNIAATDPRVRTVVVDGQPLTEVQAAGKTPAGEKYSLAARFASRGSRAWQAVVLGPTDRFKQEAADTFLESFHPGRS